MSKKHEREIREILNGMDRFLPEGTRPNGHLPRQGRGGRPLQPARLMLSGLVIAVAAGVLPGLLTLLDIRVLTPAIQALGLLGLILIMSGYVLGIWQARHQPAPRWGGRVVAFSPRYNSPSEALRFRWWQLRAAIQRYLRRR